MKLLPSDNDDVGDECQVNNIQIECECEWIHSYTRSYAPFGIRQSVSIKNLGALRKLFWQPAAACAIWPGSTLNSIHKSYGNLRENLVNLDKKTKDNGKLHIEREKLIERSRSALYANYKSNMYDVYRATYSGPAPTLSSYKSLFIFIFILFFSLHFAQVQEPFRLKCPLKCLPSWWLYNIISFFRICYHCELIQREGGWTVTETDCFVILNYSEKKSTNFAVLFNLAHSSHPSPSLSLSLWAASLALDSTTSHGIIVQNKSPTTKAVTVVLHCVLFWLGAPRFESRDSTVRMLPRKTHSL